MWKSVLDSHLGDLIAEPYDEHAFLLLGYLLVLGSKGKLVRHGRILSNVELRNIVVFPPVRSDAHSVVIGIYAFVVHADGGIWLYRCQQVCR